MPVYKYGSPDYYRAMTSPSLMFAHVASKEAGLNGAQILMGNGGENAPVAAIMGLDPNQVLGRHGHDTYRVEVIVRGSMTLDDGQVLTPGDVQVTLPGDCYGPHTAGPEGVVAVEIFASALGLISNLDPGETDPVVVEQFGQGRKAVIAGLTESGVL